MTEQTISPLEATAPPSSRPSPPPGDSPPPRYILPVLGIGSIAIGMVLLFVLRMLAPQKPLPVQGHMPAFSLTDQAGEPFTDKTLHDKVWVADFIFTSCMSSCPKLTERMAQLQKKLAADAATVHLVSFSVDPEADTPAVLAAYAAKIPADTAMWTFVTGPIDKVREAVVSGFKMTMERVDKKPGVYDVMHGNWLVLGDRAGAIRGYYQIDADADLDALVVDVKKLERESLKR